MDLKLLLGKSLDSFTIGESLRNVMLTMQCSMPKVRAIFLYDDCNSVLNDIYIMFNVDFDEEFDELHRGRYLIEFDPFLQIVRAINYTVSTCDRLKPNAMWRISGSFDISQRRPLTVRDFMSVLGDPLQVFTVPQGKVLKLLYDGLCLVFELDHPLANVEDIKKLESHLTDVRLVPTMASHFRCLVERTLPIHSVELSLYGLVQIGLVIEEKYDQVVGINVTFPSSKECENSSSAKSTYSKRVYFGQSCQCVMMSLGAPDFVYYQQMPTTHLMVPPRNHSKLVAQQFIFNYRHFGLDIVFDVEAKQVKKFIFHSNLPDRDNVNMYSRCFYKFGITETGFAKKGQSLLVHPGVDWSTVRSYVAGTHVRLLSKIHRNDSTNALYLYPLSSVWVLFNQLVCEITGNNSIATISVCSLCNDQKLGVLGRIDEGSLVETSFRNITDEYLPSSLSSVDNGTAVCSSDVKISLPDDDNQPQTVQPAHPSSVELPSTELLEESVTATSYQSTQSEVYHSCSNNNNQDDERGKAFSDFHKSYLPYAYPFQAYHPTRANQMSPCPNNTVITMQEDASREAHDINHCQLVYVETFTEGVNFAACKEASDHILMENDKWRISCYSKEEQEAIDSAAVQEEEELQAMHQQQSLEENFVCDSAMTMITEQPPAITNNDITMAEFEETGLTSDQEWQAKTEENSYSDEKNEEEIVSSDHVAMSLSESSLEESTQANNETDNVSEDVTVNKPITSLAGNNMLERSTDIEGDKVVESELVYKPQSTKMAASRTQSILKTVTSVPKKHGEYQPKKKKPNLNFTKPLNTTTATTTTTTTTTGSHDQKSIMKQNQVIPKTDSTKAVIKPSTKMDHRKVHFYTEEKSKAITAKLKSKESIEIVRRAHKDGSAYPRHHFKSNQLSALLHQGEDKVSDIPCKVPSTSTPSTFNRIFADDSGKNIPKAEGVVQGLNTPFATEYNSTVYSDITDGEDLLASSDDQNVNQDDQTANKDDQTASQDVQTVSQDNRTASQDDDQTASQEDQITCLGNHTTNQDTNKTTGQVISEDHQATNSDNLNNQSDFITNQNNQIIDQATNQIFHDNKITTQGQITSGLSNGQNNQAEELGASSILNVVSEVPFDVTADQEENGHKTDLSDKVPSPVNKMNNDDKNIDNCNGELSAPVEDFNGTSTANSCPNQLEPTSLLQTPESYCGNEGHETVLSTKETSTFNLDEQHGNTSLGDDTFSSLVTTDDSTHLSSAEHFSQEDLPDEEDNSQNTSPRKHWSSTQLQSTPDSLNQVPYTIALL